MGTRASGSDRVAFAEATRERNGVADRLAGKITLITGAASGIGRSAAEACLREGASLVATDIDAEGGKRALGDAGGSISFLTHDVTSESDWRSVVGIVEERFGRLDVLVNNAGIGLSGPVVDTSFSEWQRLMRVNVDGVFLGVKHGLPLMRASGGGSIVNVSSIAGITASPNASAYCASKGAVRLFTKSVALECADARDGVRVNSVHPGPVDTAIWDTLLGIAPGSQVSREAILDKYADQTVPLGRLGTLQEIAAGIVWLASDESSFVTGAELVIDGGKSIR